MERIQGVLLKLQELYFDKRQKTTIDLELMLDYTRVLYADLLEWRKNVPAEAPEFPASSMRNQPPAPTAAKKETKTPSEEALCDDNGNPVSRSVAPEGDTATSEVADRENIEKTTEALAADPLQEKRAELPAVDLDEAQSRLSEECSTAIDPPSVVEEPATPESEHPKSLSERENTDVSEADKRREHFKEERSGISFEPPHASEAEPIEPPLSEPEKNQQASEDKNPYKKEILEQKATVLPDYTAILNKQQQRLRKDIRAEIGINDRYLYLNELFGNQKSLYESVLARLNEMETLQAARSYIREEVATENKWDDDDETVQDFYALLQKHFTGR